MRRPVIVALLALLLGPGLCRGQVGGNAAFSQTGGKAKAEQRERELRQMAERELPPTSTSMFVDASVLMNVKADAFVAVFGLQHEGETLAECARKMDATLRALAGELKALGVAEQDVTVDFVTQNRIYGFQLQGDTLHEKLVGFELKKNVAVRTKEAAQLDRLALAASRAQVFDLIKVDYVVKDVEGVQDRLMAEASRVIKKKVARYDKLLGTRVLPPAQVYAERTAVHYPTQMYDACTAFEAEEVRAAAERPKKLAVRLARKSQTFCFNPLDASGFNVVINPVVTEPVVQFTLYLKLRYEIEPPEAERAARAAAGGGR